MNCGKEKKSNISYFHPFGCQCLFLTLRTTWESLILSVIMEHYLGTLKHPRQTSVVEEAIHVRFNNTKPNTEILELDESFANIRLDEGIGPLTEKPSKTYASNQVTEQPQKRTNQMNSKEEPFRRARREDLSKNKVTQLSFQKLNPIIFMMPQKMRTR